MFVRLVFAALSVGISRGDSAVGLTALGTNVQLCINYANEKLQQLFVLHTIKAEQMIYKLGAARSLQLLRICCTFKSEVIGAA